MGLVCCNCHVEMRVVRNGVLGVSMGADNKAVEAYEWDKWHCPSCGLDVLSGRGRSPVAFGDACEDHVWREMAQNVVRYWRTEREKAAASCGEKGVRRWRGRVDDVARKER